MSTSRNASYYDLIPSDAKAPRSLMKGAEEFALIAVRKDTWGPDRVAAKQKVIPKIKHALHELKRLGGPPLDLKATVHEVYQRAIEAAQTGTAAPSAQPVKWVIDPKSPAAKFKLPRDVVTPISGNEDIARKYRIPREPRDSVKIQRARPPKVALRHPGYRNTYKRKLTRQGAAEGEMLADDFQFTAIRDDNQPGPGDASSSRVPSSYTINCLAADLQVSFRGGINAGDAETETDTAKPDEQPSMLATHSATLPGLAAASTSREPSPTSTSSPHATAQAAAPRRKRRKRTRKRKSLTSNVPRNNLAACTASPSGS